MSLIVHAPNVHHGGGRALLVALLEALAPRGGTAILDQRLQLERPLPPQLEVVRFAPTLRGRLSAEWALAQRANPNDHVLCFANLPPLWSLRARVSVLVQNRYLVAPAALDELAPIARLRIGLQRRWLRHGLRHAQLLVQTPSMANDAQHHLGVRAQIVPFLPSPSGTDEPTKGPRLHDFVYVASGEPHKNHRRLIGAWVELARRGHFPSLCLTLDPPSNSPLLRWIDEQSRTHSLRVVNAGQLSSDAISVLYASSHALIYPSLVESFGLPLLEAQAAGLPIVAAERDYVRDVVTPAECFDPLSPVSMARAVLRHLKKPEPTTIPLSAQAFVAQLLLAGEPSQAASNDMRTWG